jgi:hypothetical protein
MPSLRISWRCGALAAYGSKERDEGVASPRHSVYHRIILSVEYPAWTAGVFRVPCQRKFPLPEPQS